MKNIPRDTWHRYWKQFAKNFLYHFPFSPREAGRSARIILRRRVGTGSEKEVDGTQEKR
jgi:hypothetical protein